MLSYTLKTITSTAFKFTLSKLEDLDYFKKVEQQVTEQINNKVKVPLILFEGKSTENKLVEITTFLNGKKIDPSEHQRGYVLPSKLGQISSVDVSKDLELRQKTAASFSMLNSLTSGISLLREIPALTASHSQTEISQRIVDVSHYLSSVEETARAITASNLQEAFQHRMDMRRKVLGSLEPQTLKNDLLRSSLFSEELFPKETFAKADERAQSLSSIPVMKSAYENSKTFSQERKRGAPFSDPTVRKKSRGQPYYKPTGASRGSYGNLGNDRFHKSDSQRRGSGRSNFRGKSSSRGSQRFTKNKDRQQ